MHNVELWLIMSIVRLHNISLPKVILNFKVFIFLTKGNIRVSVCLGDITYMHTYISKYTRTDDPRRNIVGYQ